jgi:hypothetical protein
MGRALIAAAVIALVAATSAAAIPEPGGTNARALTDAARPASVSPDDRAFNRVEIPYLSQGVGVDDRALSRAVEAAQPNPLTALRRADARQAREDALRLEAQEARAAARPSVVVIHDPSGYRWLHAGEGAAVGFGFALLLGGLALLIARQRRVVPAV